MTGRAAGTVAGKEARERRLPHRAGGRHWGRHEAEDTAFTDTQHWPNDHGRA